MNIDKQHLETIAKLIDPMAFIHDQPYVGSFMKGCSKPRMSPDEKQRYWETTDAPKRKEKALHEARRFYTIISNAGFTITPKETNK